MYKVLFVGGSGTISAACVALAAQRGLDVTVLNRGNAAAPAPIGVKHVLCDVNDEGAAAEALKGREFDAVADFVVFRPEQAERDVRLFAGRTAQYVFISSASAYQKPASGSLITESTPLANPYWQYSRDKIACEDLLTREYRERGFPVTVVRPSHTYSERSIPVAIHGRKGSWPVVRRIMEGKPVIAHGDGLTWWTFTHAADFAVGFVGLLANPHAIGEAVHITSDERLTWNMAFEAVGRAVGRAPDIRHVPSDALARFDPELLGALIGDKANSVWFDNSKIKRLVPEFNATIRFDQGVRAALAHIMPRPELQPEDPEFDAWCDMVAAKMDAVRP
jgi:nucleoside-diphosphate-sugar epimerase